jgi:hypothetical protein
LLQVFGGSLEEVWVFELETFYFSFNFCYNLKSDSISFHNSVSNMDRTEYIMLFELSFASLTK